MYFYNSFESTTLIEFIIKIFMFIHLATCFWKLIAVIQIKKMNWISYFNLYDKEETELYYQALYFILTTTTLVGYGNIHPTNTVERAFVMLIMIMSVYIYSAAIGKLTNMYESNSNYELIKNEKLKILKNISEDYKISKNLYNRIRSHVLDDKEHYHYKLIEFVSKFNEYTKLHLVNCTINKKVFNFIFLKNKNKEFVDFVVKQLYYKNYFEEEYIYKLGQFIQEGKAIYILLIN